MVLRCFYSRFLRLKQILIGKLRSLKDKKEKGSDPHQVYDDSFYEKFTTKEKIKNSEIIFPIVEKYVKINSVIDIGCGVGAWSKYFHDKNALVKGYDFNWVPEKYMAIPKNGYFVPCDLNERINLDRKFDLVINIEVAEHLKKERAKTFVEDLTKLGDVILFSAAIPYQGGDGHLNEQFPEYWAKIFNTFGYVPIDVIRPQIWRNKEIYQTRVRQNMLLFVKSDLVELFPKEYRANINCLTRLYFLRFLGLKKLLKKNN